MLCKALSVTPESITMIGAGTGRRRLAGSPRFRLLPSAFVPPMVRLLGFNEGFCIWRRRVPHVGAASVLHWRRVPASYLCGAGHDLARVGIVGAAAPRPVSLIDNCVVSIEVVPNYLTIAALRVAKITAAAGVTAIGKSRAWLASGSGRRRPRLMTIFRDRQRNRRAQKGCNAAGKSDPEHNATSSAVRRPQQLIDSSSTETRTEAARLITGLGPDPTCALA